MSLRLACEGRGTHRTAACLASTLAFHTALAARQAATRTGVAFECLACHGISAFHQGPEAALARQRLARDTLRRLTGRVGEILGYHACQLRLATSSLAKETYGVGDDAVVDHQRRKQCCQGQSR